MIDSIDDFRRRLSEIDILITYARSNQHSLDKYKLFNKMAVVLLCSHFEMFVEAFIAEHVDLLKACYDSITMPQYMKDNFINDTFKAYKNVPQPSKKQRPLRALFLLHGDKHLDMKVLNDLVLDVKYGFGKHGQDITDKLFKKFGFAEFVSTQTYREVFSKINSSIAIRNNIIHEGSASTVSHNDVIDYKNSYLQFVDMLEKYVIDNQVIYYGRIVY